MSAVAVEPKMKTAADPHYAQCLRLSVVYFRESAWLQNELQSASVALPGFPLTANSVDSISPACIMPDGSCVEVTTGARGDGLLLSKRVHNLHTGARQVLRTFVPWSGVRCLVYAE